MELTTISDIFDTKLHAYEGGLQLDEYEKSIYLTAAQDVFYDAILANFEESNTISEELERVIKTIDANVAWGPDPSPDDIVKDNYGGIIVDLENPVRKILREKVVFTTNTGTIDKYKGKEMQVMEERLSEIQNSLNNPFRKPGESLVLRSLKGSLIEAAPYTPPEDPTFPTYFASTRVSLYIPEETEIARYIVTIGVEPNPIILEALPDGLSIKEQTSMGDLELSFKDKDLEKIIDIAVQLAKADVGVTPARAEEPMRQ